MASPASEHLYGVAAGEWGADFPGGGHPVRCAPVHQTSQERHYLGENVSFLYLNR